MNFQIRITNDTYDIARDYLDGAEKFMVFHHTPQDNPDNKHYHIYLFNSPIQDAGSIRKRFERAKLPKSKYAVGTTAGKRKEKITEYLAYQYGLAPKSNPKLVEHKGFTDEQFAQWELKKDMFYDMINSSKRKSITQQFADGEITVIREIAIRPDKVWERLVADEEKYSNKSLRQIKSMICAEWINNGKPVPRGADLHRYAVSLHIRSIYKNNEVPDNAFENEF